MSRILQRVAPIGEARDKELLREASSYIYRQAEEGDLTAHVFHPVEIPRDPAPVVVFFHGGFWDLPMATQFVPHCLHFAARGAVAVTVETRSQLRHGSGGLEAIDDARELIRWLRRNADLLNIDPGRVTVAGAAGGAWQALLTAMPVGKESLAGGDGTDCRPQALVLFSAAVSARGGSPAVKRFPDLKTARRYSPLALVRRKLPPMLMFHGGADRVAPVEAVERFRRKLRWRGNRCELVDFQRADHSFFNFNVNQQSFELTLELTDQFLRGHGLLDPEPLAIAEPAEQLAGVMVDHDEHGGQG